MNGTLAGLDGFARAGGFMLRHRMAWMFLAPVVLWLLFAAGLFRLGGQATDLVQQWAAVRLDLPVSATDRSGAWGLWDDLKGWVNGAREAVLWLVVKLAVLWLMGLIGKYVVLVLLSPLMAYASERTEEVITGRETPFRLLRWLREVLRGMGMALRNGLLELAINIAAWAATLFVPLLAPLTALFLWAVSCWFYGFSMFDYIHERRALGIRQSVRAARGMRGTVLANGLLFSLLMKVPLLGLVAAPLLASVGAVLAVVPPHPATPGTVRA
jgi:CysZ protein